MSALDIILAFAGVGVTALVVAGMILITPRGEETIAGQAPESQGAELSRTRAPDRGDTPAAA